MKVLVLGAGEGLGREIARLHAARGSHVIIVDKKKIVLDKFARMLAADVRCFPCDLSKEESCMDLYKQLKDEKIDMFVNAANLSTSGYFPEIPFEREVDVIKNNMLGGYLLMKLFLRDFNVRGHGTILNVCKTAALYPQPLQAAYGASDQFLYNMTVAAAYENKMQKGKLRISVVCFDPFDNTREDTFETKTTPYLPNIDSARYVLKQLENQKTVIIPSFQVRVHRFFARFLTEKAILARMYRKQKQKLEKK